ncbi:MAG: glycerol-3-phosphate 1-O-acyltransferase PlsY [Synergistales bacterium]|jgi:glycerol-3-phosphate acyltransferase PlsY
MVWLWPLAGYFAGSIPTGYLVVRILKGEDIRNVGSGNTGATNVGRVAGKFWAVFVAIFDMTKGGLVVLGALASGVSSPWVLALTAVAGVIGHNYPVWLRFSGGKGVATSFGVLFFLDPLATLIGGAAWFLLLKGTRTVSLSSMVSLTVVLISLWILGSPLAYIDAALFLVALSAWRHRDNIRRLVEGTERKTGDPQVKGPPPKDN